MAPSPHEVVAASWASAGAGERTASAAPVSEKVLYPNPRPRGRVRGVAPYERCNATGSPYDPRPSVVRVVAEGARTASWTDMGTGEERQGGAGFSHCDEPGRIAEIADVWPGPCDLGARRARLVERD